jgi:copper(I)-binding protein
VSRNSRRAVATAIAGVFAMAPLASGCAAGQHPQSALPTRLTEGVNASVHQVAIRNAFLLGPASGQQLAAGGSAPLYAWFVNNAASPDRLVSAQAPGVAQSVQVAGGGVVLPPNKLVNTVQTAPPSPAATAAPTPTAKTSTSGTAKPGQSPSAPLRKPLTPGGATSAAGTPAAPPAASSLIVLTGLARSLSGGETVRVTLNFQQAGTITLEVPVVPRSGYYGTYSPAPAAPTPSATPLPGKSTPTPGATTTPARAKSKKKKASATPTAA